VIGHECFDEVVVDLSTTLRSSIQDLPARPKPALPLWPHIRGLFLINSGAQRPSQLIGICYDVS
jgi:hypothetical protein